MRKHIVWLPALLICVFIAGCGNHTSTTNSTKNNAPEAKKKGQDSNSKQKKQKKVSKTKRPKVRYQPVDPPNDAKPFKKRYSKRMKKYIPTKERNGNKTERTVPLGETLIKGKKDHTNGPLKKHRLVAFYGTPNSDQMGVLGEKPPKQMMKDLRKKTKAYSRADPSHPAVPTLELIATIAQRNPGPSGDYIADTPKKDIKRYVKLAKNNHALLLLDIQLGQASVMEEVKKMKPYLKLPHVHLAIDTEYSVEGDKVPGEDLGHIDGAEIQKAVEYVNNLVEKNNLPDKIVLIHQFSNSIISHKNKIRPTKHVEVPLNYDGFGKPKDKMSTYAKLVRKQGMQYGGFKLFFQNDKPLLKPKQVLKLDPAPAVIDYQ